MVYSEKNPWRNLPRGVVESPSPEDFKVQLGRVISSRLPFPTKTLDLGELLGITPHTPGLFCGYAILPQQPCA